MDDPQPTAPTAHVELRAGMTHAQARDTVAAKWANVVLRLYYPTASYYKDGPPYDEDTVVANTDLLQPRGSHATDGRGLNDPVILTGTATHRELRDLIFGVFGLEPQFNYLPPQPLEGGLSLDQIQAFATRRIETKT